MTRRHYIAAAVLLVAGLVAAVTSLQQSPAVPSAAGDKPRAVADRADRAQRAASPAPTTAAPPPAAAPAPKPAWVAPVGRYSFTSPFGQRWGAAHVGVDLAAGTGTPIMSAASGTVVLATTYDWGGYGFAVVVDHGGGIQTLYGHNSRVDVTVGQHVEAGQTIALMGSTGNSTGSHCHFEIHTGGGAVLNGNAIDPEPFMLAHGVNLRTLAQPVEPNH
ncbi:M23 family metallopeptidase [Longispora urticae]